MIIVSGMITTRIGELARGRGHRNAHQFALALKLSSETAARLYNDRFNKLSLQMIEKLCIGLECRPTDLFIISELTKCEGDDDGARSKARSGLAEKN